MKRIQRYLLSASLLAIGASAMAQTTFQKIELNVVGGIGITTQYKELEEPLWSKKIPAATNGAITGKIKPWNEMGLKGGEVYKLLRQGLFDIGTTQMGFMAGDNAINDATDLAGVSTTIEKLKEVTDVYRPTLDAYYEKQQNLKILGLWSFQSQILYCRSELKGLADLKGRKVRVSGASQADFVEYLGGSGVNMPFGDVQQALQNGVIDCSISGTLGGYKAKWFDGAKFLYPLPINWGTGISAMNMNTWKKLTPATQAFITAQYKELEKDIYAQNIRENDLGVACNTKGPCSEGPVGGMTLVAIQPADLELRRKALVERVLPKFAERCGAECTKNWNATVGKVVGLTATASN